MKHHSAWFAAGLLIFAVLACNLSKNKNTSPINTGSPSAPSPSRPANADVYVDQVQMAKDDNGRVGASTTTFEPSEHTVRVVITLNKAKAGTRVRVVWIAAAVEGVSDNKELKAIDYTTSSFEKRVPGYLTSPKDWPKGQYRVEVYLNGALDKTLTYAVE